MNTCRPKISSVVPLYKGIYCDPDQISCALEVTFSTTDTYQSSEGFSFSATVSAEADFVFAKASASTTIGTSYDYTWGREDGTSDSYTFNLNPGGYCIPSMVHIELECDTAAHKIYYDTAWRSYKNDMWLEPKYCRPGGPYTGGQFCRSSHVSESILSQDKYWTTICQDQPHRGQMWTQTPSELNRYKTNSADPDITDDEMPIRRVPKWGTSGHDSTEVFVCTRYWGSEEKSTVRIPAAQGEDNALMGFIGCVHSGDEAM